MYELWQDEAALAAQPNYTGLLEQLGATELTGSEANKYTVTNAEPLNPADD